MCAIAGIWKRDAGPLLKKMLESMAHRGPDGEGIHVGADGVLGHRRLAIMDPEGGGQPLTDAPHDRALVANGEIYNDQALRKELGVGTFSTRSDSECILRLYGIMGQYLLPRLHGMYAFGVDDQGSLFLARDPLGIKPLYYGFIDGELAFASELKALSGRAEKVREFPPGASYHSRHGFRPADMRWVSGSKPEKSPEAWASALRAALESAVESHLMSDAPLGVFLSGGLDSSVIAALAKRRLPGLHSFAAGMKGSPDLKAARRVASFLGTTHHEAIFDADDIRRQLPEIIYQLESFDQDLVRSAVPCWFVSQLASRHVKAVLTGEGADELFAGYRHHRGIPDEAGLERELKRSVSGLHNTNLQRVDRMTMAHGLEGRVPFLDLDLVSLAMQIPGRFKLGDNPGRDRPEKWILRRAFQGVLPEEILWRPKQQFDEGSGVIPALAQLVPAWLDPADAGDYMGAHPEAGLRSHEEAAYHKLLAEAYRSSPAIMDNVARWAERGGQKE